MLTVAIVYCDKDAKYVPNLIRNINECVQPSHEIVLVDNTTRGTPIDGGTYYWMGGNKYATQGRKKAVELAKGEYIWFVDADDEVYELKDFDFTEDMIVYGYEITGNPRLHGMSPEGEFVVEDEWLFKYTTYNYMERTLWNKIIRTSIVREVESLIPDTWLCVAGEDVLLYTACYCKCKKVRFKPDVIYRFRADLSTSGSKSMTCEKFRHILNGCKETNALLKELIGDKADKFGYTDNYVRDIGYYFGRLDDAVDEKTMKEMLDILCEYFGTKKVVAAINGSAD